MSTIKPEVKQAAITIVEDDKDILELLILMVSNKEMANAIKATTGIHFTNVETNNMPSYCEVKIKYIKDKKCN